MDTLENDTSPIGTVKINSDGDLSMKFKEGWEKITVPFLRHEPSETGRYYNTEQPLFSERTKVNSENIKRIFKAVGFEITIEEAAKIYENYIKDYGRG